MVKIYKLCIIVLISLILIISVSAYSNKPKVSITAYINKNTFKTEGIPNYEIKDFQNFVKDVYQETPIFSGYSIRVFLINKDKINLKMNQLQIKTGELKSVGLYGWADPSTRTIKLDKNELDNKFLLEHETGHLYLGGHSKDGSIMDANGGNRKFTQNQINKVHNILETK